MPKLHIYRRPGESPNWNAQVYVGGKRYRFTCHTTDKRTAREYAQQRAKELEARHNRGLVGLPEPVRVSELLDRYEHEYAPQLRPSARRRMMDVVRQARRWFGGAPLHDPIVQRVTASDVQAFLNAKRAEGVSARTLNLYRANLHRVFQLAVRPWALLRGNPVAGTEPLRHDPRDPVVLSEAEYKRLRDASGQNPMLRLFVVLAWETGARSGELLALEWDDVDFAHGTVTFVNDPKRGRQTKGRRSRTIPLSAEALAALRAHAAEFRLLAPRSRHVFKHTRRTRMAEPGERLKDIRRGFATAAKRAGLKYATPHCLRHSFATRKLAAGVPVQMVQHYLGHRTIQMTLSYSHLVPEHLRSVVENPPVRAARQANATETF